MVSVANCAFLPQLDPILLLPQPLITYKTTYNKMSSTSTPPLTILEPATPPQSQHEVVLQSPSAATPRLTDFSIAAILGNNITITTSPAFSNQTFTTIQNSPVATNKPFCDPGLRIATNTSTTTTTTNTTNTRQSDSQAQQINQDNDSEQQQQQKQATCKRIRPKKYQCPYCWVALSNTGQFKGHIRIHTGERPFICECGKSFTRNEELTRHKRIHTGLRPYSCPICNKCFGRKDHLKKHTRTHEKGGGGGGDKLDESSANETEGPNISATNTGGSTGGGVVIGGSSSSSSTSGSSCNGSSSGNYSDHTALLSPHQQMAPTNFDISGYLSAMNLFSNMMANTPRYSY